MVLESANSGAMESGSETESKPKKKPGRKMMMTEPANVILPIIKDRLTYNRNVRLRIGRPNEPSANVRKPILRALRIESPNSNSLLRPRMLRMLC